LDLTRLSFFEILSVAESIFFTELLFDGLFFTYFLFTELLLGSLVIVSPFTALLLASVSSGKFGPSVCVLLNSSFNMVNRRAILP